VAVERSQPIIFDEAPDQSAGECQTCQKLVWTNYQDAGYWNRHIGEYQPDRNCGQGHYDDPLDSPESEEAIGQLKHGSDRKRYRSDHDHEVQSVGNRSGQHLHASEPLEIAPDRESARLTACACRSMSAGQPLLLLREFDRIRKQSLYFRIHL